MVWASWEAAVEIGHFQVVPKVSVRFLPAAALAARTKLSMAVWVVVAVGRRRTCFPRSKA